MIRHGLSHTAASLVCVVGGDFFTNYILASIPPAKQMIEQFVYWLSSEGVNLSTDVIELLLTVSLLSFFWGVLFKSMAIDN